MHFQYNHTIYNSPPLLSITNTPMRIIHLHPIFQISAQPYMSFFKSTQSSWKCRRQFFTIFATDIISGTNLYSKKSLTGFKEFFGSNLPISSSLHCSGLILLCQSRNKSKNNRNRNNNLDLCHKFIAGYKLIRLCWFL